MKTLQDAYVIAAARTPIGKAPRGMFKNTRPDDLLVRALQATLGQVPQLDPALIDDVIVGCAMPEGEQGFNVARMSALLAGLPHSVSGITVNRFCASGLSAIAMAADRIRVGEADVMIAAGTESMSMVPVGGFHPSFNPQVVEHASNLGMAYSMGVTAEKVATQWNISRVAQDEFALQSHLKACQAIAHGEFNDEICPVDIVERMPVLGSAKVDLQTRTVNVDEGPRKDTNLESLAKLKPVFAAKGSVTAGNSSQTSDGAGALILVSEKILQQFNLRALARFAGFAVKGVPPEVMGIGPKVAIPAVLKQTGLKLDDIGWIELNEAFAAQSLAVVQDLGLNPAVLNPLGGAIALGHPLGATGAIRACTAIYGMRRRRAKYAMVTMCIGTGMGAAGVFENV